MSEESNQGGQHGRDKSQGNGGAPRSAQGGKGGTRRGSRGSGNSGAPADRRDDAGRQRHRGGSGTGKQYSELSPAERQRTADPARAAAFEVLRAVEADDAYANLALPGSIRRHKLDRRDAGFATELTYGALREQGRLDAVLQHCIDRPIEQVDPPVRDALRLGAYQLLNMRVPAHAALDATVALTRQLVGAGAGGFVNAVLRRVSERTPEAWEEVLRDGAKDEEDALATLSSHPAWIVRAMRQALVVHGRDAAELPALLAADNAAPTVNLVSLPGLGDPLALHEAGANPSELVPGAFLSDVGGDPGRLPGVAEGAVRVQDAGSQLVARALAFTPLPNGGPDRAWLDICAGPGGKAALLGAVAAEKGAHLEANEVAKHRGALVTQGLKAVPADAWHVEIGDGRRYNTEAPGFFDRIMLDAPCSGLGALRRRPEARWRKQPTDIPAMSKLQSELLASAIDALRPGGLLAYVTCSPHPAETVAVVEGLLRSRKDVRLLDTGAAMDAVAIPDTIGATRPADAMIGSDTGSTVQLFPHTEGTDAMFIALLTRD